MKKTLNFQTEVTQLLQLMIHSLYSNKEIFLRELVSNASDAIDKLRFESLKSPELLENDTELKISITADSDKKTITISDNGIGMNEEEIIENLGTIAKSGTKSFLEKLTGDEKKDAQLIGQFGVGFYSAFIVAESVDVESRKAGLKESDAIRWQSKGNGSFSIEKIKKAERGTTITLHLKKEETDFVSDWTLRRIINTYSDHISTPIHMKKAPDYDENGNIIHTEELEIVNQAQALWTRPKNEITEEQYQEFYKHTSHDFSEALAWTHSKVEGKHPYTELLYVPKQAPFDLYERDHSHGVKLYVKRVFIMDDAKKLMPSYLRFIKGIIDSDELPLNVSREILQESKELEVIRSGCVKKVLDLIQNLSKNKTEDFKTFWQHFGTVFKEGIGEDLNNKEKIASLCLFSSTNNATDEQNISLDGYIERMKEGQENIYYITADNYASAKNSPHLEVFLKKGIEVLLLTDRVDEWVVGALPEYKGKKIVSVAKGSLDLGNIETEEEKEELNKVIENNKETVEKIKKALDEKVSDVKATTRLTESPACLIVGENDMSQHLARMLESAGASLPQMPNSKPTLEINPEHLLIQLIKEEENEENVKELSDLVFDQALLAEGGKLDNPAEFIKLINKLLISFHSK